MPLGNLRSSLGLTGKTGWVLEQSWGGNRCREIVAGTSWEFGPLLVGKGEPVADFSLEVEVGNGGGRSMPESISFEPPDGSLSFPALP